MLLLFSLLALGVLSLGYEVYHLDPIGGLIAGAFLTIVVRQRFR